MSRQAGKGLIFGSQSVKNGGSDSPGDLSGVASSPNFLPKHLTKPFWCARILAMGKATTIDLQEGRPVSVVDAANTIGVHITTLYRQIQKGKIVFITFGDTIFIPFREVERLKNEREARSLNG